MVSVIGINFLINTNCNINRIYLYIVAFILSFITILLINIFVGTSFSNEELDNLVRKCQHSISDPRTDVSKMKAEDFANYTGTLQTIEGFAMSEEEENEEENEEEDEKVYEENDTEEHNQEENEVKEDFTNPNYFIDDRQYHETKFPLGDSWPPKSMSYKPLPDSSSDGKCLLGRDGCAPLCSGYSDNKCNIVAPIPGPTWQVQNAATVQERLKNQDYTKSVCSTGPSVLSKAPDCKNLDDFNAKRDPYQVTCYPSVEPQEFPLPANQN